VANLIADLFGQKISALEVGGILHCPALSYARELTVDEARKNKCKKLTVFG
jgi:hypothetical protein